MGETTGVDSGLAAALKSLRAYLLDKGHYFDRGPSYESGGVVLPSVQASVEMYQGLGYTPLIVVGRPPVYAVLTRGRREVYLFQIQDPKIHAWLGNAHAPINDPAMRSYMMDKAGLTESDLPVRETPRHFHINEVDDIFIVSTDDPD